MLLSDITPGIMRFPSKFSTFRKCQIEMADYSLYGPAPDLPKRRFTGLGMPTGSGKSPGAELIGELFHLIEADQQRYGKYMVLTATKALEEQYLDDGYPWLEDVRGKANYQCLEYDERKEIDGSITKLYLDCDQGHLTGRCNCQTNQDLSCPYLEHVDRVRRSHSGLTNYAYWMSVRGSNRYALEQSRMTTNGYETVREVLPIRMLICDEGHRAFEQLASHLGTWVGLGELRKYAHQQVNRLLRDSHGKNWDRVTPEWALLIEAAHEGVIADKEYLQDEVYNGRLIQARQDPDFQKLEKLEKKLKRLVDHAIDGNWLWQLSSGGIEFRCIWPQRYAEKYLWSGVEKVILMSAGLRPKHLQLLGLDPSDYWYREWGSVFDPRESPVYWIPTGQMGFKASEEEKLLSVRRLEEIWEIWGIGAGLKGIVHTNSYKRAEWMQSNSKYGKYMLLGKPGEATDIAKRYRESREPVMLVSPSFAEGFDFPSEPCGWQVIAKVPFPDKSDPVVAARMQSDKSYMDMCAAQTFTQACGRKKRNQEQRSITFCTDDAIALFGKSRYGLRTRGRDFFPSWFRVQDAPGGVTPKPGSVLT